MSDARDDFGRPRLDGFFKRGKHERSVVLSESLLNSDAWFVLSPTARCVLADWINQYNGKTHWEERAYEVLEKGMTYTWAHCRVNIWEGPFREARKEILKARFFEAPAELQRHEPGGAVRYRPSTAWREFEAPEERTRFEALKRARLSKSKSKREKLLKAIDERQRQKPTTETVGKDTTESVGTNGRSKKGSHRKCGVVSGQKAKSSHRKCGVLQPGRTVNPSGNFKHKGIPPMTRERQNELDRIRLFVKDAVDRGLQRHAVQKPRVLVLGPTDPPLVLRMAMLKQDLARLEGPASCLQ